MGGRSNPSLFGLATVTDPSSFLTVEKSGTHVQSKYYGEKIWRQLALAFSTASSERRRYACKLKGKCPEAIAATVLLRDT